MKRELSWTNEMPSEKGTYVSRRKGSMPYLKHIQRDRKSGELYFWQGTPGGVVKCFRADWPTDRLWFGPLPKGRWR